MKLLLMLAIGVCFGAGGIVLESCKIITIPPCWALYGYFFGLGMGAVLWGMK